MRRRAQQCCVRAINGRWGGERLRGQTEVWLAIGGTHGGAVGRLPAAHLRSVSTPCRFVDGEFAPTQMDAIPLLKFPFGL
jgi:hypothetical protein